LKKTWWKFQAVYLGIDFLGLTLKAQAVKAKLDKWDCIKIKSFYTARNTINEGFKTEHGTYGVGFLTDTSEELNLEVGEEWNQRVSK
jgi:hypothetical protein